MNDYTQKEFSNILLSFFFFKYLPTYVTNEKDPLGIALQQTLGIGMSLDFDHDSVLSKGEMPSLHRLRARMIKSAIRRTNHLIFKEGKEKIDTIKNPKERLEVTLRIANEAEEEIKSMKETIISLIPTNAPQPEGKLLNLDTVNTSNVVRSQFSKNDDNASEADDYSNSILISQEPNSDPWKNDLDQEYGIQSIEDPYLDVDEEFLKDYMKQQKPHEGNDDVQEGNESDKNGEDEFFTNQIIT